MTEEKKDIMVLIGGLMFEDRDTMAPETLEVLDKYEGEASEYFCRLALSKKNRSSNE